MNSGQGGMGGRLGLRVPAHYETALEQAANELDYEAGAHRSVSKSEVVREALDLLFVRLDDQSRLPEETRDLFDTDLRADAGGDVPMSEIVELDLLEDSA